MVGKDGSRPMNLLNKYCSKQRAAFTLIEIAISILVLVVGLAASMSMISLGLDWGRDVRINTMAIETLRTAVNDATVIDDSKDNLDPDVRGHVNGFYIIRKREPGTVHGDASNTAIDGDKHAGSFSNIDASVYYGVPAGGDETDGELVWQVQTKIYER